MANIVPANQNLYRIPYTNVEFVMTPIDKKVLATALACFMLLGVQFSLAWPITFFVSCALASVIFIFEQAIDREKTDWFNTEIDKTKVAFFAGLLILKPLIIYAFCWALGIPLPGFSQEGIKDLFLEKPMKLFFISSICAPFSEEILFRGVLLERLEDFAHIINRYTCIKISKKVQEVWALLIQSVIFGIGHLNQKIEEGMKITVGVTIGLMGYIFGLIKNENKSLIPSIAYHSANNIGASIHILNSI